MSARSVKTHMIASRGIGDQRNAVTFCGKNGREVRGWRGEFDTPICNRFHATDKEEDVDCKTCLRALKKAKNAH